jgi:hypothetical protein
MSPRILRRSAATLLGAVALIAAAPSAVRWGEVGHRTIADVAVTKLPADMPAFFVQAKSQLIYLNPEPDRWRDNDERRADPALDGQNAPDHFLDMEGVPEGAYRAPNRPAFIDSIRPANLKQLPGFLPFRILELTQRLRIGFKQWRSTPDGDQRRWIEARIINDAGILGHYVADAANPHHTTIHHNGWVGENPNGFATDKDTHWRFENDYVKSHIGVADFVGQVSTDAKIVAPLRGNVMSYLNETHSHLVELYTLDKAERFDAKTTAASHKAFVTARLAAGATMLRDLWWTAYATSAPAGAPGN